MLGLAAVLLAGGLAWCLWPRAADLRRFAPAGIAARETAMWRAYYEHRPFALARELYGMCRHEHGFSPFDSVRLAYWAARAATTFQPTTSRAQAEQAVPMLENYFAVMQGHTGSILDVTALARAELDWWQLRRERATPDQYGDVLARVEAGLYGVPADEVRAAARLRAAMMAYRDARDGRMQAQDWAHIEHELTRSYALLAAALTSRG